MNMIDTRESDGYTEDIEDIDPNYPPVDELHLMDIFLSNYTGFVDKINGRLSPSDTIALYAVYIDVTRN